MVPLFTLKVGTLTEATSALSTLLTVRLATSTIPIRLGIWTFRLPRVCRMFSFRRLIGVKTVLSLGLLWRSRPAYLQLHLKSPIGRADLVRTLLSLRVVTVPEQFLHWFPKGSRREQLVTSVTWW